jgi:diguanylate cyclase (GGDEF)-like protein
MIISASLRRSTLNVELLAAAQPILAALLPPIEAEGTAVVDHRDGVPVLLCQAGEGSSTILNAINLIVAGLSAPSHAVCADGRPILVAPWQPPTGQKVVVAFWRKIGAEPWEKQDHKLVLMAAAALGALALYTVRPKESAWRRPVDDLTGLPRARKLVEDLPRRFARLDRDRLPGTLIIASIDGFKKINEAVGRAAGDDMLRRAALVFQGLTRPTDVVARIGGDEFAIWLDGVDQFTAAERAERLKADVPALAAGLQKPELHVSLSIGIATRQAGSNETINSLMRRADYAMHEARDIGPGNWRLSQERAS